MKKRKQTHWLVNLYNDNKFYVWIVVGIIVLSGVTIGMAIGESSSSPKLLPNDNAQIIGDDVVTNTQPVTQNSQKEKNNKLDNKTVGKNNVSNSFDNTINNSKNLNIDKKNNEKVDIQINENEEQNNAVEEKKVELKFGMPIEGEILRDFSDDTLVYSNTLEEWISHTGIDILGERATPVKAIEAGTIIEIKEDPRYGYTIIIDHGQGYQSIYCNLSTLDMAQIGKVVEKGQVISGIGETALFEIKDNSHLHFEIIKDGQYVDPLKIIK